MATPKKVVYKNVIERNNLFRATVTLPISVFDAMQALQAFMHAKDPTRPPYFSQTAMITAACLEAYPNAGVKLPPLVTLPEKGQDKKIGWYAPRDSILVIKTLSAMHGCSTSQLVASALVKKFGEEPFFREARIETGAAPALRRVD